MRTVWILMQEGHMQTYALQACVRAHMYVHTGRRTGRCSHRSQQSSSVATTAVG